MGRRLRTRQYLTQEKEDSQKAILQFHTKSQLQDASRHGLHPLRRRNTLK